MPLPADKQKRLVRFLGMMGSVHDAEALTAARKAVQIIQDEKASWDDVFGYDKEFVTRAVTESYARGADDARAELSSALEVLRKQARDEGSANVTAKYQEGYDTGYAQGWEAHKKTLPIMRAAPPKRASVAQAGQKPAGNSTWNVFAKLMLDQHEDELSEWECSFCADWVSRTYAPSEKQRAIFDRMASKTGETAP